MVRAGVDPDLIGRTAEVLAARESADAVDEQAERRRARDRERKRGRIPRNSAESAESAESVEASQKEKAPHTPLEKNSPLKEKTPKGVQKKVPLIAGNEAFEARRKAGDIAGLSAEFDDRFWPAYPQKVAKPAALKAFMRARTRADLEAILAGLNRYVAKRDDRPWCNPATWLNQDRWNDAPVSAPQPIPRSPPAFRENLQERQQRISRTMRGEDDDGTGGKIIDIGRRDYRA
nr:hypothetical protein [Martelella sp. HB161492]